MFRSRGRIWTGTALVALTDEQRASGLSQYRGLGPRTGMLFAVHREDVFTTSAMTYPLDMVWLGGTGRTVLRVDRNVQPGIERIIPPMGSVGLFEVEAGGADGIQEGATVSSLMFA